MKLIESFLTIVILSVLVGVIFPAMSAAGPNDLTGHIYQVDATDAGNFPFRIYIDPKETQGRAFCTGSTDAWAYVDNVNKNYNTYVATLLSARASLNSVTIYTTPIVTNGATHCSINYIIVNPVQ